MNKEELLKELSTKVDSGEIRREDVLGMFPVDQSADANSTEGGKALSHFSITKILYILGAAIVVIGLFFFMVQIWDSISTVGRIAVTLGLGLVFAVMGSVLLQQKPGENIGLVFHVIGGSLVPGGVLVTLHEYNITGDWTITILFAGLLVFYLLLNHAHKHAIFTFFAIVHGTITAYLLLNASVGSPFSGWRLEDMYQYLTISLGAIYLSLAYAFREGWNSKLIIFLHFFGISGLLGAAFSLVFDSGLWEVLFVPLVIGGLFLSVYMKSRSILIVSTLFLIGHISYITGEYFADSLGWPLSLIILGFLFIGLGYVSITINKKYIQKHV